MATSSDNQGGTLAEKHGQQEQLVQHIRGLLARADARRDAEPENYRKWNRVLDNLETALSEAKSKLQLLEIGLRVENTGRSGAAETFDVAPASKLVDPIPATEENPNSPETTEAARTLLETPLEAVEEAPLEQVALAQRYLAWRQQKGVSSSMDRQLAGRVELAIQGRRESAHKPPVVRSAQERRHQTMLRELVTKIQRNRIEALTIQDILFAAECYGSLTRRLDLDASEARLKDILQRALREAERLLEQLQVYAAPSS